MTKEMQKTISENLFVKNKYLFFNRKESSPENESTENPFILKIKGEWNIDKEQYDYEYYELKDDTKKLLLNLNFIEILEILKIGEEDVSKNTLITIKNWITFFGVALITQMVIGIIIGVVILFF